MLTMIRIFSRAPLVNRDSPEKIPAGAKGLMRNHTINFDAVCFRFDALNLQLFVIVTKFAYNVNSVIFSFRVDIKIFNQKFVRGDRFLSYISRMQGH